MLRADARNLAKPTATGAKLLQCQGTTQEIGDFLGACVKDSATHHAEPGVGSQTPPEIGNVDRDECGPRYCPEKHRDSFVEDDCIRTQLGNVGYCATIPASDRRLYTIAQELLIEDNHVAPARDVACRASALAARVAASAIASRQRRPLESVVKASMVCSAARLRGRQPLPY